VTTLRHQMANGRGCAIPSPTTCACDDVQPRRSGARRRAAAEAYGPKPNPVIADNQRIFTSQEEEELPEHMCDGHVARRKRGKLTNEACVNRICDLVARGITETEARQYIGVGVTEWGRWRARNECLILDKMALAIALQNIVTADECRKIIDDPDLLKPPKYNKKGIPLGPTVEQKLRHAMARVQHRQWHLARRTMPGGADERRSHRQGAR
jgi:hypothetical protein